MNETSAPLDVTHLRLREGAFWLGLFLVALLVTAGVAEARGPGTVAIDGVSLDSPRPLVEKRLGASRNHGDLAAGHWFQYCSRSSGDTTVTYSNAGSCIRVKGSRLSVDGHHLLSLGDDRSTAIAALGRPAESQSRKGREVMEFRRPDKASLYLVLEDGLLIGMSAARE